MAMLAELFGSCIPAYIGKAFPTKRTSLWCRLSFLYTIAPRQDQSRPPLDTRNGKKPTTHSTVRNEVLVGALKDMDRTFPRRLRQQAPPRLVPPRTPPTTTPHTRANTVAHGDSRSFPACATSCSFQDGRSGEWRGMRDRPATGTPTRPPIATGIKFEDPR